VPVYLVLMRLGVRVVCGVQRRAEAEDMEIWAGAWRKIASATLGGENGPGPASLTPECSSNGSEETFGTPTTPTSQYALFCCYAASVQHHDKARLVVSVKSCARSRVPLLGESTDAPLKLNHRLHAKVAAMKQPGGGG
jgi:hypothetical protein